VKDFTAFLPALVVRHKSKMPAESNSAKGVVSNTEYTSKKEHTTH
jgi:hypothetical protein